MRIVLCSLLLAGCASTVSVEERPVADLARAMAAGETSSEAITRATLARIARIDPSLNSIILTDPQAIENARLLDQERTSGRGRGTLHGVNVALKDNIAVAGLPTTAGSLALVDNIATADAPLVARLRAAGAVVIGKAALSEWANIRSTRSVSGWSAVGGLVRNPHALDRNVCGSSSGSAAAVAASLATVAIGTETDGSIVCPASVNGVVGLKPTLGLVSRTGIVPISAEQDTAGPMTRTVADAAAVLDAIAGSDPADPATVEADRRRTDYSAGLHAGIRGVRIGVMRDRLGDDPALLTLFESALAILRAEGAELVEIAATQPDRPIGGDEFTALKAELVRDLDTYLATTPPAVRTRSLRDVVAFNAAEPRETVWFGQDTFEAALAIDPAEGRAARIRARDTARATLARLFADNRVTILIAPTTGPAWISDPVNGDQFSGPSASQLPAVAGTPHLTVPMGAIRSLPVGLSFLGPAWSEASLLAAGAAYEGAANARPVPTYRATVPVDADPPR